MFISIQDFAAGRRGAAGLIGLAALLAAACPSAASATAAPAPAYAWAIANQTQTAGFGPAHEAGCEVGLGCWDMSAETTHSLVATASGSLAGNVGQWVGSGASIAYQFIVTGPEDLIVPLNIKGYVSARTAGAYSAATAWITYGSSGITVCSATFAQCGATPDTAVLNDNFFTTTGALNYVHLVASGAVLLDGSFSALADPTVTIDPTWLAANPGFSLAFSPDVINGVGGGAPEPATWALMLGGFALAGSALRRRPAAA